MVIKKIRRASADEIELANIVGASKDEGIKGSLPESVRQAKELLEKTGSVTIEVEGSRALREADSIRASYMLYADHPEANILKDSQFTITGTGKGPLSKEALLIITRKTKEG